MMPFRRRLSALLRAFGRQEDGSMLAIFAIMLPVLLAMMLLVVDYGRATQTRQLLQTSLDAATLYTARSDATSAADIQAAGMRMLKANMAAAHLDTLADSVTATFTLDANQRVAGTANTSVPTTIAAMLGMDKVPIGAKAQVARASNSLEVALALDVTGSMAGQDLVDLKKAASDLIDLVVKDQQTPYYSKVALAPYSYAVNVGSYANLARGTPTVGCTSYGCEKFYFRTAESGTKYNTFKASSCVTERTGANAYTDAAPGTSPIGFNYPNTGGSCLSSQIVPLSTNRTQLKATVNSYIAEGATAGHIGLAWAWYLVSPNFGSLWTGASKPADYGTKELVKVVVLMTDGEFNTQYWNGVPSVDSTNFATNSRSNQAATNGSSFSQAAKICTAIKAKGIILYTVGLGTGASSLLTNCATSKDHAYFPSNGTALKDAFRAIAQEINALRISQ